jgi:hypothetical protein
VPVPKKPKPQTNNDYRPVALTPALMKCFEHLVLRQLVEQTACQLDPLQFAYKRNRSVEDATALLIHRLTQHLEGPGTYARVLFVDFSSAFNTMRPSTLYRKLVEMGVSESLCAWILDYLRCRKQQVRVGVTFSSMLTTNIGAPQGCVLSPVLFTIYTNNHRGEEPHTCIPKYADDAALVGLISKNDETHYRQTIENFTGMCKLDDLELNVKKTKEMVIDFRKAPNTLEPVKINETEVETVTQYPYLGTLVANDLTWCANTNRQVSKATKRMYHLRKLREFKVCPTILKLFYTSVIASVAVFGISVRGALLPNGRKEPSAE